MRQDAPEDGHEPSSDPLDHAARLLDEALREHAAGRPAQALAPCLQALSIADGEEAPPLELVVILNTLGMIHLDLCDFGDAHDSLRRAADVVDNLVADEQDAPVLTQLRVRVLANLANVERAQGQLDQAERHYLDALAAAEALTGRDDASLGPLLNDLAVVYKYAARFDEAEALYQRALAAIEATLGPDHPDTATVWHNLGGIEHARGRHAAGESYARRSVQIREAALGAEHPAVAADIAALAALVQEQGRLDEAECLYRRALSVFESTYGTDHYEVAVTCNNLGKQN